MDPHFANAVRSMAQNLLLGVDSAMYLAAVPPDPPLARFDQVTLELVLEWPRAVLRVYGRTATLRDRKGAFLLHALADDDALHCALRNALRDA